MEVIYHSLSLDDHEMTTSKINEALKQGVDLVLCTGGMSVDPDDKTPLAIKIQVQNYKLWSTCSSWSNVFIKL